MVGSEKVFLMAWLMEKYAFNDDRFQLFDVCLL